MHTRHSHYRYVIAFREGGRSWLRVSAALYLQLSDYQALAKVQRVDPLKQISKLQTPNLKPKTQNPKPKTQNPKPKTQNPKPKTQNPKLFTRVQAVLQLLGNKAEIELCK